MTQPIERKTIPIFRPAISEDEIAAVTAVLRSQWLGPGPVAREFESAFAQAAGSPHSVSTSTGTAALTCLLSGLDVAAGDEVIIPSFTYVALFQAIVGLGAVPVFADIEPGHLTLDPEDVARRITPRTRGIIAVHHGGQLAAMDRLRSLSDTAGVWLIDDAAHAAGARYGDRPVGSLATATYFSFSAVKNLTTGDGGMITTADESLTRRMTRFRNLGIEEDTWARYGEGTETRSERWAYRMHGLGQRLHLNDVAAAIGIVQLRRLPELNRRRAELVQRYEQAFAGMPGLQSIQARAGTTPSWHMYTVLLDGRDDFIDQMRGLGLTVGVHYYPVHLYSMARSYRTPLPVTERIWPRVTTFPLYPTMTEDEQESVIEATRSLVG